MRVTDLQNTVIDLQQRTTTPSATESAAAHLAVTLKKQFIAPSLENRCAIHGQGHDVVYTSRGFLSGGPVTPAAPPVIGPLDFSTPMNINSSGEVTQLSSSQVFQSLGQAPPPIVFPPFSGENPQLWRTLCKRF